jgi:TRAP transporter TAXI family solute receptor
LESEVEKSLVSKWPYYVFATIPKGTYESTTEDVTTFGAVSTLITSERVGEDVVYDVVRAIMEGLDELRARHSVLLDLDPKEMIRDGLTAPLHPGAIRYYKEREWM